MSELSEHQQKVLDYLKSGGKGFYMTGLHSHFFLSGSNLRVTVGTWKALKATGLVVKKNEDWRGFTFVYQDQEEP